MKAGRKLSLEHHRNKTHTNTHIHTHSFSHTHKHTGGVKDEVTEGNSSIKC
jgi:hypothetical protein